MAHRMPLKQNEYLCAIELNQSGKYCLRLRVTFGRRDWVLSVYFLASSFDRGMKKLAETMQYLQRNEERLWFWTVDRSDDPNFAGELLREAGLRLDHRTEFPRRQASMVVSPNRPVPAFLLAPLRRGLAESVSTLRVAAAGD
ncbi:MAG: hypothetical protein M1453_15620 [Acidobacteria bacterium]|nr:hypothetical protein [Acidobacteriota bacterium]MCL5289410.1 hypothetical protein [Acidobacteriota bacterium]